LKVTRTASAAFTLEFESEQELRDEERDNLSVGGLRLRTAEPIPLHTTLLLTLRGPSGAEAFVRATVVAPLPDGLAVAVDGDPTAIVARLLPPEPPAAVASAGTEAIEEPPVLPAEGDEAKESSQNIWDRFRAMSQMEKILLAVKADRTERALLLQDSDPRVLLSLLRNPRVTIDEIIRLTKSSNLTFQIAEVIVKTGQWMGNLDVRTGLIHNPKTPPAFAMRILPTMPESEVRVIARTGTNMALKTAALRQLQKKP
jgi:hypothetical protein